MTADCTASFDIFLRPFYAHFSSTACPPPPTHRVACSAPHAHSTLNDACNPTLGLINVARPVILFATDHEMFDLLVRNGAKTPSKPLLGMTPIMLAVRYRHYELARLLMHSGADANRSLDSNVRTTPLLLAAWENQLETATVLLQYGAAPNQASAVGEGPLSQEGDDFALLVSPPPHTHTHTLPNLYCEVH